MVVTWAIDQKGYSQRRACALIGIAPKTYRDVTSRGDDREFRASACCRTPAVRL
jgi:putative transposase